MTLGEIIGLVDEVMPNPFSNQIKVIWLNELEERVQSEALLVPESAQARHVWSAEYSAKGALIPNAYTLKIPDGPRCNPGGTVTLSGFVTHSGNNGKSLSILTVSEDDDGNTVLVFAPGSLDTTGGDDEETGTAKVTYAGTGETMLAPEIFDRIYYTYLEARVDAGNGEYERYANALQLFNQAWAEYMQWHLTRHVDHHENIEGLIAEPEAPAAAGVDPVRAVYLAANPSCTQEEFYATLGRAQDPLAAVYNAADPEGTQDEFYEVLGRFYLDEDGDLAEKEDV